MCDGLPRWHSGKESACQCQRHRRRGFVPWVREIPGVGNGNPFQYSWLENSMDRGAWWATVHVSKSWAQLSTWACRHAFLCDIYQTQYRTILPIYLPNYLLFIFCGAGFHGLCSIIEFKFQNRIRAHQVSVLCTGIILISYIMQARTWSHIFTCVFKIQTLWLQS